MQFNHAQRAALRGGWVVFCKEIKDNLRDRRTLSTMGISIVIGPLLMFGFIWFAEKTVKEETDPVRAEPVELAVKGAEHAPNLMSWLEQRNISVISSPEETEQAIRDGALRVALVINNDFSQAFLAGEPAPIRLIYDSSITGLEQIVFQTVQNALQSYGQQIASLRLVARGVSPQILQPLQINVSDVASPEARNAQILTIMPYLIIMFIMAGGMYLAIDTTAGEREKGSLEPLLTQPLRRHTILLAKLAATIVFSSLTFLLVLIGLALAFNYAPIESITLTVSAKKVALVFFYCLPFVIVAGALMVLLAAYTKSYKEAQSYLSMVMLVPSLPLIMLAVLSPEPSITNMWVPSLSHGLIIIETFKGEVIAPWLLTISAASSLSLALIIVLLAIKLYRREGILG